MLSLSRASRPIGHAARQVNGVGVGARAAPLAQRRTSVVARADRVGKPELVDGVAAAAGLTKKDAALAVEAVLEEIASALGRGAEVALVGFGTFKVGERAAREGRNPRTGESIPIAASKSAKFAAGKGLKDRVNGTTAAPKAAAAAAAAAAPAAAAAAVGRKTAARAPTASAGPSAAAGRKTTARRSTTAKSQ
jgi:DNA-binding protein HU-beta